MSRSGRRTMVEVDHADDDASEFGSAMSSCLPMLVFHHYPTNGQQEDNEDDDDDDEMLMFSLSKQSLHTNMKRGLLGGNNSSSMCWATPQGWMLLVTEGHDDTDEPAAAAVSSACLWNPLTGDKLPLPDIREEDLHRFSESCRCLLSFKDPTRPGCVVVLFSCETPNFWYCHTAAGYGDDNNNVSWRHQSYDIGNCASVPKPPKGKKAHRPISRPIKRVIPIMASLQGKIYFSKGRSKDNMCAIDFSSCTSTTTTHNRPRFQNLNCPFIELPQGLSSGKNWLVESQDQLFAVNMGYIAFNPNNIGAIEVYRMDSSSSTQACWCRVHDIGDVVFLLEQDTNMAASSSASALGLKANQILFMKNIIDDDADLCIFDLETNTQELTQVHHHNDDMILCRKPFWIVPPS